MPRHDLRAKWDAITRQHHHLLKVWVIGRGIRPGRAEEICQDTWLRLWQQDVEGRLPYVKMPGLAFTQARWLIETERRRRKDDDGPPGGAIGPSSGGNAPPAPQIQDHSPDAFEFTASREILEIVLDLIDELPSRQREIFLVCRGEESYEVAAHRLGCSVQHAKQTVCQVVARLREGLDRRLSERASDPQPAVRGGRRG